VTQECTKVQMPGYASIPGRCFNEVVRQALCEQWRLHWQVVPSNLRQDSAYSDSHGLLSILSVGVKENYDGETICSILFTMHDSSA